MRGGRRQQRRRRAGKILSMLACSVGAPRVCGHAHANICAGYLLTRFNCWRAPTVLQGFAGRSTPTKTPAGRKNPEHVGVFRRSSKGLRACPRQHLRRIPANEIQLLACPDGAQGFVGKVDITRSCPSVKRMFTLYKRQSPKKKVKNHTIWALV